MAPPLPPDLETETAALSRKLAERNALIIGLAIGFLAGALVTATIF